MIRRKIIAAAVILIVLGTGMRAYGYWMDQVNSQWEMTIAYPVLIEVELEEESEGME